MKFTIKHETKKRMRIHVAGGSMTYAQADILLYSLHNEMRITFVKVYERTGDAVIEFDALPEEYSHFYLAIDGKLAAVICIEDPLREEAEPVVNSLRKAGFTKIVIFSQQPRHFCTTLPRY